MLVLVVGVLILGCFVGLGLGVLLLVCWFLFCAIVVCCLGGCV